MTARFLVLCVCAVVAGFALACDSYAHTRSAQLEHVASIFAMRPAEVRCPNRDEWQHFTYAELWQTDAELVFGVTHLFDDWMMLRPDLCDAAARAGDESVHPSLRALAVLTFVHEAYHVRRWAWRRHEGRVECQAIRHFRVAAELLGAAWEQADRLYYHARVWHYGIARPGSGYYWPRCGVPG